MIQKIYGLVLVAVLGVASTFGLDTHADVQKYYLDAFARKGVAVIADPSVQITIPSYIKPDLSGTNMDIAYWISTLPAAYQNHNEYFIFPKAGTVVPIVNFSASDKAIVDKGGNVDHFPYLEKGAVHHRGKKPQHGKGNFTIAGHTSFEKNLPGDFKTNMQGIILADIGDTVIYVHKIDNATWKRYIYKVTSSYETSADNVSILLDNPTIEHELTVYGCSPIGTTEKRRVIKSTLHSINDIAIAKTREQALHGSAPTQSAKIASGAIVSQKTAPIDTEQEKLRKAVYRMPLRTEDHFTRMIGFFQLILYAEKQGHIPSLYTEQAEFMKQILFQRLVGYITTHKHLIEQLQELFSAAD